jgi:hypothetical protein
MEGSRRALHGGGFLTENIVQKVAKILGRERARAETASPLSTSLSVTKAARGVE